MVVQIKNCKGVKQSCEKLEYLIANKKTYLIIYNVLPT